MDFAIFKKANELRNDPHLVAFILHSTGNYRRHRIAASWGIPSETQTVFHISEKERGDLTRSEYIEAYKLAIEALLREAEGSKIVNVEFESFDFYIVIRLRMEDHLVMLTNPKITFRIIIK